MRRPAAFVFAILFVVLAACGSAPQGGGAAAVRQPTDPRSVPTATAPAVLPSPIPAGPVTDVNTTSSQNAAPSVYDVKSGDTLAGIAQQLGVSLSDLESYNPNANPSSLKIGQELTVPPSTATPSPTPAAGRTPTPVTAITVRPSTGTPGAGATATRPAAPGSPQSYTVQAGDTACKVAGKFNVSLQELAEANGSTATALANLHVGQQLKIPAATGSPPSC